MTIFFFTHDILLIRIDLLLCPAPKNFNFFFLFELLMIIRAHAFNSMVLFSVFYTSACISRCCIHIEKLYSQIHIYLVLMPISAVLYVYIKVWMRKWYMQIHMYTYASFVYVKKKVFRILSVEIYLLQMMRCVYARLDISCKEFKQIF